eukprot:jgi/Ulvmu1/1078/UM105_0037.1
MRAAAPRRSQAQLLQQYLANRDKSRLKTKDTTEHVAPASTASAPPAEGISAGGAAETVSAQPVTEQKPGPTTTPSPCPTSQKRSKAGPQATAVAATTVATCAVKSAPERVVTATERLSSAVASPAERPAGEGADAEERRGCDVCGYMPAVRRGGEETCCVRCDAVLRVVRMAGGLTEHVHLALAEVGRGAGEYEVLDAAMRHLQAARPTLLSGGTACRVANATACCAPMHGEGSMPGPAPSRVMTRAQRARQAQRASAMSAEDAQGSAAAVRQSGAAVCRCPGAPLAESGLRVGVCDQRGSRSPRAACCATAGDQGFPEQPARRAAQEPVRAGDNPPVKSDANKGMSSLARDLLAAAARVRARSQPTAVVPVASDPPPDVNAAPPDMRCRTDKERGGGSAEAGIVSPVSSPWASGALGSYVLGSNWSSWPCDSTGEHQRADDAVAVCADSKCMDAMHDTAMAGADGGECEPPAAEVHHAGGERAAAVCDVEAVEPPAQDIEVMSGSFPEVSLGMSADVWTDDEAECRQQSPAWHVVKGCGLASVKQEDIIEEMLACGAPEDASCGGSEGGDEAQMGLMQVYIDEDLVLAERWRAFAKFHALAGLHRRIAKCLQ